jgi:hypothetical protein
LAEADRKQHSDQIPNLAALTLATVPDGDKLDSLPCRAGVIKPDGQHQWVSRLSYPKGCGQPEKAIRPSPIVTAKDNDMLPPLDAKEWTKLASGLEIWEVTEGTGEAVRPGATVTVHYTGWLTNGQEFDSSRGDQPVSFPLSGVIRGWQEGIPGMKPGGIRRLKIPAALGYGSRGAGNVIPPNATLIFEVELIK